MQGHTGVALESRVNRQRLWEESVAVIRGRGDHPRSPLLLWEDVIGLFE